jgi:CO dehydrogenase maturation factor
MRIAIAGKGGSGKTTIAGTLARLLARRGRSVVAIDGDTNPNLAQVLGMPPDHAAALAPLPLELLVRREDPAGTVVSELSMPAEDVVALHAQETGDGVRLLLMGCVDHAGVGCKCRPHAIARNLVSGLLGYESADSVVIVDMEAGLEHLSRGTTRDVDALLAIAEPYYRSLETARRVCALAAELGIPRVGLVANKTRDATDEAAIRGFADRHALRLEGVVPFDAAVGESDRLARGLLDVAGADAAAVRAIDALGDALLAARSEAPLA